MVTYKCVPSKQARFSTFSDTEDPLKITSNRQYSNLHGEIVNVWPGEFFYSNDDCDESSVPIAQWLGEHGTDEIASNVDFCATDVPVEVSFDADRHCNDVDSAADNDAKHAAIFELCAVLQTLSVLQKKAFAKRFVVMLLNTVLILSFSMDS